MKVVGAVVLAVLRATSVSVAGDWTDTDCRRWEGTPQYADCARAFEKLANSDCSEWTPGGPEFVKCQHARNILRVQRCQAAGEARRKAARNVGWDGIATVTCPLANEQTGELNGARPMPARSAFVKGDPPRAINIEAARRAARLARTTTGVQHLGAAEGPPAPRERRTEAERTGPRSWSNIFPAR